MVEVKRPARAGGALNADPQPMLVLDRGAAGKIRIAAADAGAEVDGNDAAAAGHGNARHRRSPTSSVASSSGARSGRDASFRGGIGAMTGSGLASAGVCS